MKYKKMFPVFTALNFLFLISSAMAIEVPATTSTAFDPDNGSITASSQGSVYFADYAQSAENVTVEKMKMPVQRIALIEGRSHLLRFSTNVQRISVSNPQILDFLTLSPREVILNGKQHGSVNLMVWDLTGKLASFDINVTRDPGLLDQLLHEIDPDGSFEIYPSKDVFVVKGETSSVKKMKILQEAVENFSRGSVSLVRVKNVKQILLKSRFIQVDHTKDREFGLDIQDGKKNRTNTVVQNFLAGQTATDFDETDTVTLSNLPHNPGIEYAPLTLNEDNVYQIAYSDNKRFTTAFLKALEDDTRSKTIARPNLLAKDGEEASFLVGGETAILVSTSNNVNVEYKEFGTRLTFKPEIMEDGDIMMSIEPEVSTLSDANGVTVGDTQVPGFTTTRVKTVVQMSDRSTLLIGGLIQQQATTSTSGVPFFKGLPVIGKLFESTTHGWQETELIVIVTPEIILPEKEPIGTRQDDMLAKATELVPSRTEVDLQTHAIRTYLNDNNRWKDLDKLEKELDDLSLEYKGKKKAEKKDALKKSTAKADFNTSAKISGKSAATKPYLTSSPLKTTKPIDKNSAMNAELAKMSTSGKSTDLKSNGSAGTMPNNSGVQVNSTSSERKTLKL